MTDCSYTLLHNNRKLELPLKSLAIAVLFPYDVIYYMSNDVAKFTEQFVTIMETNLEANLKLNVNN